MEFLRFLENIRIPVINELMLAVTYLGDEIAFLAIALVLFWCIDKRQGYFVLSVGFIGTLFNQFLKLWFRVPRPWVLDKEFTILEQAREGASGYSFPSGHTQSSVGTFGGIAYTSKNKIVRVVSIILAILIPFSRMYIGVHTPADVLVSVGIALLLIFVLRPVIYKNDGKAIPYLIAAMTLMAIAYLCFVEFYPFPADIDPDNLASGIKNAYTLTGGLVGLTAVYIVERKWIKFPTKAIWWAQLLKVLIGLAIVLAIKSGLSTPMAALLGEKLGRAVRYFIIVVIAGVVWPMSFKWFAKLGCKE